MERGAGQGNGMRPAHPLLGAQSDLSGLLPLPPRAPGQALQTDPLPQPPGTQRTGGLRGRGRGRHMPGRMGLAMLGNGSFDGSGAGGPQLPFRPEMPPLGGPMMGAWPGGMWPSMAPFMPGMPMAPRPDAKRDRWAATRVIDNDYCQHFVDTGERPQNFLRDSKASEAFQDHPKLKELVDAKRSLVEQRKTPAYALQADLSTLPLNVSTFGTKFDVLVIDPPWEEYARRNPEGNGVETWSWDKIRDLAIPDLLDTHAFVFLWCGNEEAVEAGRHCFTKWGLHRIEDICWVKTNRDLKRRKYLNATHQRPATTLHHVKEHCLVGRKGDINRKRDSHFVHTNVDVDIILSEEPELGSLQKPEELYDIIERFCLGRRRLELFGMDHNVRDGWVTVGIDITVSNFNRDVYAGQFLTKDGQPYVYTHGKIPKDAPHLLGTLDLIESLRPRSP